MKSVFLLFIHRYTFFFLFIHGYTTIDRCRFIYLRIYSRVQTPHVYICFLYSAYPVFIRDYAHSLAQKDTAILIQVFVKTGVGCNP